MSTGVMLTGLLLGSGQAGAAVDPGLYRICPVATNLPGSFGCRTMTAKQYVAEARRTQVAGIGYGPLISTPYGGYMQLHAFGKKDSGRLVFRRTATGYDAQTGKPGDYFYAQFRMTKLHR